MVGSFLRKIRQARGLSQSQLAELVGIDQPNLSAYERDRRMPSFDTLHRIATACGFRLVAEAGALRVPCPVVTPTSDRLPGDPSDDAAPVVGNTDPAERGRALEQVLRLAEATRGHR